MLLTVIIPTYNRNDLLDKCLAALATNIPKIDRPIEVIVSDDSPTNSARPVVDRYPWATWSEGPKKGPAANRNAAAKKAKGQWLLFTDDDCLPAENWLSAYSASFTSDDSIVYEGLTTTDRPKARLDEEAPVNLTGGKLWSCNFAISNRLFASLGGFDESFPFPAMEDVDFQVRAVKVATVRFLPEARIVHPWRKAKPFASYKKHILSHKHFRLLHATEAASQGYRIARFKILLGHAFSGLKELAQYRMKGWQYYLEHVYINLVLLFI